MNDDVIEFRLSCKCGYTIEGTFYPDYEEERLHCECGLVWEVKRPVMDKEAEV